MGCALGGMDQNIRVNEDGYLLVEFVVPAWKASTIEPVEDTGSALGYGICTITWEKAEE